MFKLTRLKVRGFRGFVDEWEFEFDQSVVLLFGENHLGKSSTLNAVEWCLFGEECIGQKTGIRERVGWEIPNRYAQEGGVRVEAEFKGPDGSYLVMREWSGAGRRASGMATIQLPDGTKLSGEDAEARIYTLFRSSFLDFMTTVYQHQEAIRAVLTQEPRQRNDAIDRLLGLSEYHEVLKGIVDAELERTQNAMDGDFEDFRIRAEQSIHTYDGLIKEEKAKAVAEGIKEEDMTEQEALGRARGIAEAVRSLAQELGVGDLQVPVAQGFDEIAEFREWVKTQTDALWAQAPDVVKQEELAREQEEMSSLKGKFEGTKRGATEAQAEKDKFVRQYGDETTLVKAVGEHQMKISELEEQIRKSNARANLVTEAIRYLKEVAPDIDRGRCPLCGADAPQLLAHLESEWGEKIEKEVRELELQKEGHQSEFERLRSLKGQLGTLEGNLVEACSRLKKCIEQIAAALGREIGKEDDPGALLNVRLREVASELESNKKAIEEKRQKISGIYDHLAKLRTIYEILSHERKKAVIEHIWETKEFAQLDELKDQASQFVEDVIAIRHSLAAASREEAEAKIDAAGAALDKYFCLIANHPAIPGLVMEVAQDTRSGLNAYAFKSTDGSDPMPILSQGDLNCLALSLFLGLAQATGETQPFSFLMLDDPTQSLGPEMKQRLVSVLEGVAEWRKLIISTPDTEFKDLLMTTITKSKAVYNFLGWTEEGGPRIARSA
jgi:hypothetical protein